MTCATDKAYNVDAKIDWLLKQMFFSRFKTDYDEVTVLGAD